MIAKNPEKELMTPETLTELEPDSFQKYLEQIRELLNEIKDNTFCSIEQTFERLKKFKSEFVDEEWKIIETKFRGTDAVTKIANRGTQNTRIIEEMIKKQKEGEGGLFQQGETMGLLAFDVRGLKAVNDANTDHGKGDIFLYDIAEIFDNEIIPVIKVVLETAVEQKGNKMGWDEEEITKAKNKIIVEVSRDGGDEFSILISSNDIDLTAGIPNELLDNIDTEKKELGDYIKEDLGLLKYILKEKSDGRLIDTFTKFAQVQMKDHELEEVLDRETALDFINRGAEPNMRMDLEKDWAFRPLLAGGACTLKDVLERPLEGQFKGKRTATTTKEALEQLMGAFRSYADKLSYEEKYRQNEAWSSSEDPEEKATFAFVSRSELTITLQRQKNELEKRMQELREKEGKTVAEIVDLTQKLETCEAQLADKKLQSI